MRDAVSNVGGDADVPENTPRVRARDLSVAYTGQGKGDDQFVAVASATFDIHRSEMVCIVGPSGCGKTTVLNAIAGLMPYRSGLLEVDGRPVKGTGRDRAVVFQKAALLPWITVEDNVAYGLRSYGVKKGPARERAAEMLEMVGLQDFAKSYPYQLSGGMQQRVNLARALAADPNILLFDEPFASVDAQTRETLQSELLRIWTGSHKAGLFITHQIDEAVLLGNRVVVSSRGPASTISATIDIDIPWPRTRDSKLHPNFGGYVEQIWALLSGRSPAGEGATGGEHHRALT
ncbi:ABC transporter ATP-binding protein [Dactylosporangium sp. NPDC000555]|uniref:ABC transporter ATP-binding protein n=1 Tax=Dactylosporangium sp. NPDC000555 TaxID=3154260 RepID=UPI00332852C5